MTYSSEQYERAREYLMRRIDNEVSMSRDVERLLDEYALLLVDLVYRYGGDVSAASSDMELLIDDLVERLLADCRLLAVDDHRDREDEILAYIGKEWNGDTMEGRIGKRVRTFADEVFVAAVAGVILGYGKASVTDAVRQSKYHPWDNPVVRSARDHITAGDAAAIGAMVTLNLSMDYFDERHYGQGVPISSLVGLTDIAVFAVSAGWGIYDYLTHKDGSMGYYVVRGSSFPCDECDSHVGFHPIGDEENLPMFHNHCRCMTIWL